MAEKKIRALTVAQQRELVALTSVIASRAGLMARLGKSYSDDRDIYRVMGYKKTLSSEDYWGLYSRLDIAKRCVDLPVESTWKDEPEIIENEDDEETDFELAWYELNESLGIYHYLSRLDKLAGLGQYGVLLIGYDDGDDFNIEVKQGSSILYLRPFSEANANITQWVSDKKDPRYGMPLMYSLNYATADRTQNKIQSQVHYSRVLHVADGLLEDNVYGTPRLQAVWNTLKNVELVGCTSAEMFYRGAFPGTVFNKAEGADLGTLTDTTMEDEIEEYIHQFKRYMLLQGVKVEQLLPTVVDPGPHMQVYYDQISAATGIPKRILLGSERGELASSQDERGWNAKVMERRKNFAEYRVLRPLIDALIKVGTLPEPNESYTVKWPDLNMPSDVEKAEVAVKKSQALAQYASSPGADMVVPPQIFLRDFLGFEKFEVEEIDKLLTSIFTEEERNSETIEADANPINALPEGNEDANGV